MVNFPSVPQPAVNAWNNLVKATSIVPGLNASVSFVFKNAIATPASFIFKNVLATPALGLVSLSGKVARPSLSDAKASALTIVGLFALNYARKTTYGQAATEFARTNVGHYSGLTAKADKAIKEAKVEVTAINAKIVAFEKENAGVLEAAAKDEKALAEAKKLEATTAEETLKELAAAAEASAKDAKGPTEALTKLQAESEVAVKALTAAKRSFWATKA